MNECEIALGAAPSEESWVSMVSDPNPRGPAIECRVFRRMLLRLFPPPADDSVRLVTKRLPGADSEGRTVCVQCTGTSAVEFARRLQMNLPTHWDAEAYGELIWYSVRHVMYLLACRGWTSPIDMPGEFMTLAPPNRLREILERPNALYSLTHKGGPFAKTHGEAPRDVRRAVEGRRTLFVGRMFGESGRAVIVRLGWGEWALYRPDLTGPVACISDELWPEHSFLVEVGSSQSAVLSDNLDANVFDCVGRQVESQIDRRACELWRPASHVLDSAITLLPSIESAQAGRL